MLGALSIDGIEAMMTVEGGTTAGVFLKFIDKYLAPRLRPGDVVVMDNLGAPRNRRPRAGLRAFVADK
jgi:transposase